MVIILRFVSLDLPSQQHPAVLAAEALETILPNLCGGQAYQVKTVHYCRPKVLRPHMGRRVIDGVLMSYAFLLTWVQSGGPKAFRTLQWKVDIDWVCSAGCRPGA